MKKFVSQEQGASLVEYALLISFLIVAAYGGLTALSQKTRRGPAYMNCSFDPIPVCIATGQPSCASAAANPDAWCDWWFNPTTGYCVVTNPNSATCNMFGY